MSNELKNLDSEISYCIKQVKVGKKALVNAVFSSVVATCSNC